jgi:hypothetical protein
MTSFDKDVLPEIPNFRLKQWHNEVDPEFGVPIGDDFEGFVQEEARNLGLTLDQIKAWQPPQRAGVRGRRRAKA